MKNEKSNSLRHVAYIAHSKDVFTVDGKKKRKFKEKRNQQRGSYLNLKENVSCPLSVFDCSEQNNNFAEVKKNKFLFFN